MNTDQLRAIAFDFDGVVADTMPMLSRLGRSVIQIYYDVPRYSASDLYWKTVGLPFKKQLEECFGINDSRNATASEYFEQRKDELMVKAEPFTDILNLLLILPTVGIYTALCSSTRAKLIKDFCKKNQLQFTWIGGIEHGHKHNQILKFSRIYSISPKQITFLGDSPERDAEFARRAEVQFAVVTKGREVITNLIEKYAS